MRISAIPLQSLNTWNDIEEPVMEIYTNVDGSQVCANAERPDHDGPQPYPEKPKTGSHVDDAAREATRRYVERVDRYLARPDVISVGRTAAPSFPSRS